MSYEPPTHVGHSGTDLRTSAALAFRSIADDSRHLAAKLWHVARDSERADADVVVRHASKRKGS